MLKRLLILTVAVGCLALSACSGCGSCGSKCYGKNLQRDGRRMIDFVDVHLLNYDRHNPYRCDPCLGE